MTNIDSLGRFARTDPCEKLYSNIEVDNETECWNWTGRLNQGGYGEFECVSIKKGNIAASRASWIIHNGPIASTKIFVCHSCDNRRCVNPAHLFLGSSKINMEDCKDKGRINKGEDRPQHKLTEDDVRLARRMRQQGASWKHLAQEFSVGKSTITHAVTGETWAHVDEPIPTYVGKSGGKNNKNLGGPKYGTENGCAKLDDDKVRLIRKMWNEGATCAMLARYFGISAPTAHKAAIGANWKYVV